MSGSSRVAKGRPALRSRNFYVILFAMAGIFITWQFIVFSWNWAQGKLVKAEYLSQGNLYNTVKISVLLVKEETVVNAPVTGEIKMIASQGERVRSGAVVARLNPGGAGDNDLRPVIAPRPGLVSVNVDGLENILQRDALDVLRTDEVRKIKGETVKLREGIIVDKGSPVVKLVDNLTAVYLLTNISEGQWPALNKLEPSDRVNILWQEYNLNARLHQVRKHQDGSDVIFEVKKYPDDLVHHRDIEADLATETFSGFIVPEDALVEQKDTEGLYIIFNKMVKWVPVEVHGKVNNEAAVSGSELSTETRFITNPRWVSEGSMVE